MMMETNLVCPPDFDHPELLTEIVRCYNETLGGGQKADAGQ